MYRVIFLLMNRYLLMLTLINCVYYDVLWGGEKLTVIPVNLAKFIKSKRQSSGITKQLMNAINNSSKAFTPYITVLRLFKTSALSGKLI